MLNEEAYAMRAFLKWTEKNLKTWLNENADDRNAPKTSLKERLLNLEMSEECIYETASLIMKDIFKNQMETYTKNQIEIEDMKKDFRNIDWDDQMEVC